MRVFSSAMYAVAMVLFGVSPLLAGQLTEVVVFGDSHSDTGNWGSRASNGPLWVEELAWQLGAPPPLPSRSGGTDYAWGGAQTGWGYHVVEGVPPFPRVGAQIDEFLSSNVPNVNQLFVLFAGHNDFGWGGKRDAGGPAMNLADHVSTLAESGGANFVGANLLPLKQIPAYRGTPDEPVLATQFNSLLSAELDNLEANLDLDIERVDFHGLVEAITHDPLSFGMTNVLDPAADIQGANAKEFLYWDGHHFTTATHELLGKLVFRNIISGNAWSSSRWAAALYTAIDNDSGSAIDGIGNSTSDRLSQARGSVGESDGDSSNSVSRMVSKFHRLTGPAALAAQGTLNGTK